MLLYLIYNKNLSQGWFSNYNVTKNQSKNLQLHILLPWQQHSGKIAITSCWIKKEMFMDINIICIRETEYPRRVNVINNNNTANFLLQPPTILFMHDIQVTNATMQ